MIERVRGCAISFLTILLLAGCTPPGLRAYRDGNALLDQGRTQDAVEQFKLASSILPTNALVWNALGVAYHVSGQPAQAEVAYQRALALDRDLREARYNLGCLMLEQNRPEVARSSFTTLTLRGETSPVLLLKLADAQLRLKDYVNAERTYLEVLKADPKNAPALNGLGITKVQRSRPQEAVTLFTAALKENPEYKAALLNLAITRHQHLRDPAGALRPYRDFASVTTNAAQRAAVMQLANLIDAEINPPAPRVVITNPPAVVAAPTNVPVTSPAPAATNLVARKEPPPGTQQKSPGSATNSASRLSPVVSTPPKSAPTVTTPRPVRQAPAESNLTVEVVTVPPPEVFTPADDVILPRATPPTSTPTQTVEVADSPYEDPGARAAKRGFLQSVNPLRIFGGDKAPEKGREVRTRSDEVADPPGLPVGSAKYKYSSSVPGREGDAQAARKAFAQGLQAQSQKKHSEAVLAYLRATQLDPSYFEAQFNLAVAYHDSGNVPAALKAYEQALALRPRSVEARYNFALLLRDSNFLSDALTELEKLVADHPQNADANLALANLYAQQLRQPARARPYFQRVLEINPRHPQAGAIRYWLSANP